MPLLPASSLRRSRDLVSIVSAGSLSALALLVAATPRVATAQTVASPTTTWTGFSYGGGDPVKDQQTGPATSDIVGSTDGTTDNPFLYALFENNGSASNTDGTLYFRIRLAEGAATFDRTAVVGISFTSNASNQSVINLFAGVNNSGSTASIAFFGSDTNKANTSPSTSGIGNVISIAGTPLTYAETAQNYYYSPVTAANQPTPGSPANFSSGTGQNSGAGPDYFLGFAIPFRDLVAAANAVGVSGVTDTTAFRLAVFTSNQPNQLNQDFGGSLPDTTLFSDPGGSTGPINPNSLLPTPAPPGVVSGLIGIAMGGAQFGMMKFRRRRAKKVVVTEDAGSEV